MPVNDHLRFPSGITVQQAKKDARALSKSKEIPRSAALDIIAQSNGVAMPWSNAVVWLAEKNDVVASFTLPLPSSHNHIVDVPEYAPVVVITGDAGCGKSILSLELAKQHLSKHPNANLYRSSPIGRRPTEPSEVSRSLHMPEHMLVSLEKNYPGRVKVMTFEPESVFPVDAPAGSLILVDDVSLNPTFAVDFSKWRKTALARGLVLIVCCQSPSEVFQPAVPADVGLMIMGRTKYLRTPLFDIPGIRQLSQVLAELPNYGNFLAAPLVGNWAGIIRLPAPSL
ncbi:hypothetical protein ACT3UJ_06950 [Halomonas sp. 86]|uniref:hypothetical protein n=1 Tax=unclassified Halomonas TaxID=2609666 RepID=UPI0040349407